MKNKLLLPLLSFAFVTSNAQAEQFYGFADVNINFLDWTDKAEDRSNPDIGGFGGEKEDFFYIEVEGGAGFDWGDIYGFFDVENPGNSRNYGQFSEDAGETDGFRYAMKGSIAVNVGDSNWNYYSHFYSFSEASNGFYDQNWVLGFSYDIFTESGFWMKPFLGVHIENQTFNGSGTNGYMAGWVLGYDFQIGEQKFGISQWHETEFARKDQFRGNGTQYTLNSTGWNGAVALWWHFSSKMTTGVQYRYADHKLGTAAYHDAIIYTLKYNF
ncbi:MULTISPECIES: outer membrane protein OmpK [unclassified Thalassotalea]|uniref:outer membrane protein OmpK n=1 Tax=unclassified Thalassotalea TaxID=2614972 RepID=UPI001081334D|nr:MULTISPECIES: outer membrane protein OmpK [unclassified Thalassotalea]NMP15729.1 ion channel protein Tsx [Thalassotalea sp. Y01]QBY04783.1 ion channel protein Tsx [Thalassotalea sp. HSM 43]